MFAFGGSRVWRVWSDLSGWTFLMQLRWAEAGGGGGVCDTARPLLAAQAGCWVVAGCLHSALDLWPGVIAAKPEFRFG
jgi:hypothetical protein